MKLSFIGLPLAGKKTVFEALTKAPIPPEQRLENRLGTIRVPDSRIDRLSRMYSPKKTTYAQVSYFLPGMRREDRESSDGQWAHVRDADALIHVVRNFEAPGMAPPSPGADVHAVEQELIFADLVVVEKRLERLNLDKSRGRSIDDEEYDLLNRCRSLLESETPLRGDPSLAYAPALRGFTFLSAKPMLILFNNPDEDDALPEGLNLPSGTERLVIRGKLEHEIALMDGDEAAVFLSEFGIPESAMDRTIKKSYELLGLMSFFTVGEDEVRAWTIHLNTPAVDAAEAIHSDIKKGFIRAEVLHYDDLMDVGSYGEARKRGTIRLEGKTYAVQDADIIDFRFNV